MSNTSIGFSPDEIRTNASTRDSRLKWVIVVDGSLPAGQIVNAATCVAAATSHAVAGLLGSDALDGDGGVHVGLPWAGCSILTADTPALGRARDKAASRDDVFVADMSVIAQQTRVYDDYLQQMASSPAERITYTAISLVGPRNPVDRIVGSLGLLP